MNKKIKYYDTDGVILLLVVVILTAIFSISVGILGVIIGQVSSSETFENSNIAMYAADQSIERTFYRDRQENDFPCAALSCTTEVAPLTLASGGCIATITIVKQTGPLSNTTITARALSTPCATVTERTVARAFLTTY
ncbi:MAG: hypothetical protein HY007_03345 [Candidatus Sungbacteria bacterium]|nr:hypothetical protein [Candidatus Sungbacteria bacterium]